MGEGRLIGIAMLFAAAGAALEIPPLLASVIAGDIIFGAAIPWVVVGLITLAQRLTPPDLQGRVYAAVETLVTTPQTISIALGAGLITITGYQTAPRHGRRHRHCRRLPAHPSGAAASAAPGHLHRCGGCAGAAGPALSRPIRLVLALAAPSAGARAGAPFRRS